MVLHAPALAAKEFSKIRKIFLRKMFSKKKEAKTVNCVLPNRGRLG